MLPPVFILLWLLVDTEAQDFGVTEFMSTKREDIPSKYIHNVPYITVEYTKPGEEKKTGTIYFKLFWDKTPRTALNFARLIDGHKLDGKNTLSYANSIFHRIIPQFMMQGGDITNFNGTGGASTYGGKFPDEDFTYKHLPYSLSMANAGKDTNTSQFFITFVKCEWLDGKHVVFGEVMDTSHSVVQEISKVKTSGAAKPVHDVKIVAAGFTDPNSVL